MFLHRSQQTFGQAWEFFSLKLNPSETVLRSQDSLDISQITPFGNACKLGVVLDNQISSLLHITKLIHQHQEDPAIIYQQRPLTQVLEEFDCQSQLQDLFSFSASSLTSPHCCMPSAARIRFTTLILVGKALTHLMIFNALLLHMPQSLP